MPDKKDLSEMDIRTKFITPALKNAGWNLMTQLREEVYFTAGRIMVNGHVVERGAKKWADYVLYNGDLPLAIIEAKDNRHDAGHGMQQALEYAAILDLPFVYSSNGDGFVEHDRTGARSPRERPLPLTAFPAPAELWERYRAWKGLTPAQERVILQPYFDDGSGRAPRYYQRNAINRTVEAIAQGRRRVLLVMATGTGKTYTAFQIIWRLWKAGAKKRILFLADRNILIDQARTNDFKPFGAAMTKIANRTIDPSFEIYLALYQGVSGTEEEQNVYRRFSPGFFDLVIVDECHRGSAADDSAWREILEYFSAATQIGLTATPRETETISNSDYFGDPVYTYSLRQGIDDGFLAPYKVVQVTLDVDKHGWRPAPGERDKNGQLIPDQLYSQADFDRTVILEERTRLIARKITEYLHATDRFQKTIVFCQDINHADRMRQMLVNENPDLFGANQRYIMQITSGNPEGIRELDNFILPDQPYPVIAITSKLMSTGVDAQTCRLVVLDKTIHSMTEFKQIIGRGTRINEAYGKQYFTIMDFRQATSMFADPDFDGPAIQVYVAGQDDSPVPPGEGRPADLPPDGPYDPAEDRPRKYVVEDAAVYVTAEQVFYYDEHGRKVIESLRDYTRRAVTREFVSLEDFITRWNSADRKQAVLAELAGQGVVFAELTAAVGRDLDPFDLVCHVAYDQPPLTRRQRAARARQPEYFAQYGEQARAVLDALLDKYADEGVIELGDVQLLNVYPFSSLGTLSELLRAFGGKDQFQAAIHQLQARLYAA